MTNSTLIEVVLFKQDSDFFAGVFELDGVRIVLILFSTITSFLLIPFITGIIVFECTNSDHRIFSRFITSMGVSYIIYSILVVMPDIFRYTFGPLNENFCFWHYILKSTLSLQHILIYDAISIIRYIFIFRMKNPTLFQDAFWIFFIITAIFIFSLTSQFVFTFTPGRQPLVYYMCSGIDPRANLASPKGFNPIMVFFQLGSVILHFFTNFKIEIFRQKDPKNVSTAFQVKNKQKRDNEFVRNLYLNFSILICLVGMSLTTGKVNSFPAVETNLFSNHLYVNIYHLVNPVLFGNLAAIVYVVKHNELRTFFYRKLLQQ